MIQADLSVILPEIILALFAMGALLGAVYTTKDKLAPTLVWATAGLMIALAIYIASQPAGTNIAFNGMFVDDGFARFAKAAILVAAAIVLMIGQEYMARRDMLRFEYPILIALSAVGMMMMVSAGDLMALYMGLELQSLALYVVAALRRDSAKSTEAGLKYFVLGALSSGLLLYGASLVYGFAGTTKFAGIITVAEHGHVTIGLLFGLVFLISGLAFKVSAAPFHMWTPDVYEGAPTPVTAFFATAPKVAAMGLFARVLFDAFGGAIADWQQVIAVLSVLSMFLGAIAAIGQRDIKRLMAYSSIAHMGYALIGLAAGTEQGIAAMLTYMVIYVTMNVGTFAFILMLEKDGKPVTDISALNQFASRAPGKALAVLILLFSLAGVPPMLGFFAKFGVWQAGIEAELTTLVIASAIASVIGAFYYLRIVFFMYFGEENGEVETNGSPILSVALTVSAALMLVGLVYQFGIDSAAASAAATLVK
ncbi:NADH dehydrogenase subunit N [Epibacterium ulvae]|uniref:NADH-quinone oxidoreductase subunit N n=1 Tax=Epibacterium ulvae TaxID=1156985 RepID=A0A1G5QPS9_9RHOB|nr:NADH-quinone oxidoreductase subunit NuoN [Epibacterium ulvae]SCZ63530.1 NADH dehydrogenase subunit N [Epibacterium ulvae]